MVALLVNATLGFILTSVGNRPAPYARSLLSLSVLSVVLSWFLLHTAFGQQYARLYYDDFDEQGQPFPGGMRGGFTFPGTGLPNYQDFLYVAFTVGLTYAMSDVSVDLRPITPLGPHPQRDILLLLFDGAGSGFERRSDILMVGWYSGGNYKLFHQTFTKQGRL